MSIKSKKKVTIEEIWFDMLYQECIGKRDRNRNLNPLQRAIQSLRDFFTVL